MLTAANKATRQAQEILATAPGGLLVSQEECRVYRLTESDTMATGPCRLVGVVLTSAMEAGILSIEDNTGPILKVRALAGWSHSSMLPIPLACEGNLTVTLTGNGAEAYLFVADPS